MRHICAIRKSSGAGQYGATRVTQITHPVQPRPANCTQCSGRDRDGIDASPGFSIPPGYVREPSGLRIDAQRKPDGSRHFAEHAGLYNVPPREPMTIPSAYSNPTAPKSRPRRAALAVSQAVNRSWCDIQALLSESAEAWNKHKAPGWERRSRLYAALVDAATARGVSVGEWCSVRRRPPAGWCTRFRPGRTAGCEAIQALLEGAHSSNHGLAATTSALVTLLFGQSPC